MTPAGESGRCLFFEATLANAPLSLPASALAINPDKIIARAKRTSTSRRLHSSRIICASIDENFQGDVGTRVPIPRRRNTSLDDWRFARLLSTLGRSQRIRAVAGRLRESGVGTRPACCLVGSPPMPSSGGPRHRTAHRLGHSTDRARLAPVAHPWANPLSRAHARPYGKTDLGFASHAGYADRASAQRRAAYKGGRS